MKRKLFCINTFIFLSILCMLPRTAVAQRYDCSFKEPLLNIDFGTSADNLNINTSYLPKYERVFHQCPLDGFYTYASKTESCFNGDWFTLNEDHTPNDINGNMMLVNASETGGVFFTTTINGLSGNTTYEFAVWMMNVCRLNGGCSPLPPNITIMITSPSGRKPGLYETGQLLQGTEPHWKKYVGFFTTAANETVLQLTMQDNTIGGCGNDFALDDITIRECRKPVPVVTMEPKPNPQEQPGKSVAVLKPVIKNESPKSPNIKKDSAIKITEKNLKSTSVSVPRWNHEKPGGSISIPQPLLARTNSLVRRIETEAAEIQIDLYDNGEIDGDTVSIYHNNQLILSRTGISEKPVTFRITVDDLHPHHELVMVADNLGSIPPNTSLMIITAKNKRYEVFISSTEQKNAKVVIDLKP